MDLAAMIQDAVQRALPGNRGGANNQGQAGTDPASLQLAAAAGATPAAPVLLLQVPNGQHSAANTPPANTANQQEQTPAVDPFAAACQRLGIASVAELERIKGESDAFGNEASEELKSQAIRCFGQEKAEKIVASYKHLSPSDKKELAKGFSVQADANFEITNANNGSARQTAQGDLAQAASGAGVNAEGGGSNLTAWQRLSQDQRDRGVKMGMNTPEKQDQYAKDLLQQTNR